MASFSQIIIDHAKRRDDVTIDNVGEALNRAADNGVKNLGGTADPSDEWSGVYGSFQ